MPSRNSQELKADLSRSLDYHLQCSLCKDASSRESRDIFLAMALSLRDMMARKMLETENKHTQEGAKYVYYLSLEFLTGRLLLSNLSNMGILHAAQELLSERGVDLSDVINQECDAGLGNGGLGRLAACFLDSMATLGVPGFGYGIRYEYGLFRQGIEKGCQKEKPDNWLEEYTPWEIKRSDEKCIVPVYGHIEHGTDREGYYNPMWLDWKVIIGIPYDIPIAGYGGKTVNRLRLYSAAPSSEFDIQIFNEGDYFRAVEQKIQSETISKILYPADTREAGKELRLLQEYFLVACSLRDILRRHLLSGRSIACFPDAAAIQMNDTHPSLAVPELMRILVDEQALSWDDAWDITTRSLSFTNHTILNEALEKWSVGLMEYVLPRHLQLIYEINRRFIQKVTSLWPGEEERTSRISIIQEGETKQVRMANLAIVGSHAVNGVSELHTRILQETVFSDFHEIWPEKFINVTNGITQRRWLLTCNPPLAELITETIGDKWITELHRIRDLEKSAADASFQELFRNAKRKNKERLAETIKDTVGIGVDPASLYDVHAKRIHEYKRQLLKIMQIVHEYLRITEDGFAPVLCRTYIFAGKAAPGYHVAKQIIRLIHGVARVVNNDPRSRDAMKVVFIPDYRVSLAERIIPAADLSEQISMAGTEASGTGNMKFAVNGALTIGTMDGANIEMRDEVGEENIFIFGLTAGEIQEMKEKGRYNPWYLYQEDPLIRRVMDSFQNDRFCRDEPGIFQVLFNRIVHEGDFYFHLADFHSYLQAQEQVDLTYTNRDLWSRKTILNTARMGKFSSDRAIMEYAEGIWGTGKGKKVMKHAGRMS